MEEAVKVLQRQGWRTSEVTLKEMGTIPYLSNGLARALVGGMWTTFYKLPNDGNMKDVRSVKTDDLESIMVEGKK